MFTEWLHILLTRKLFQDDWQREKVEKVFRIEKTYEKLLDRIGESHYDAKVADVVSTVLLPVQ